MANSTYLSSAIQAGRISKEQIFRIICADRLLSERDLFRWSLVYQLLLNQEVRNVNS